MGVCDSSNEYIIQGKQKSQKFFTDLSNEEAIQ